MKSASAICLKRQYVGTRGDAYYQLKKNRNELTDLKKSKKIRWKKCRNINEKKLQAPVKNRSL